MSKIDAPAPEPTLDRPKKAEPAKAQAPRPRGRYIDFTPRRKPQDLEPPRPTVVIAPVVAVAPEPEPEPEEEVILEQTTIIATPEEIIEEPVEEELEEEIAPEPAIEEPVDDAPIDDPSVDPLADFNELGTADTEEELEAQSDFLADDDPDDYVETVLSQVSETRTSTTIRRSPFLKNYSIEKRPLSGKVPVRETLPSADALAPTPREEYKEEEFARRADSVPDNAEEPTTTPEEKTGSRLGMVLTVLITILLGAGVGVFVYLAFFQ